MQSSAACRHRPHQPLPCIPATHSANRRTSTVALALPFRHAGVITLEEHTLEDKLCVAADEQPEGGLQPPSFTFKHFAVLGRLAKCRAQRCLLQLGGADAPLSLVAELGGGATAQLFLAPVVEDTSV